LAGFEVGIPADVEIVAGEGSGFESGVGGGELEAVAAPGAERAVVIGGDANGAEDGGYAAGDGADVHHVECEFEGEVGVGARVELLFQIVGVDVDDAGGEVEAF
jgi:hypothetical protein